MSTDDALIRLGQSTSEAIAGVLEMFAPGKIHAGDVTVVAARAEPDGVASRSPPWRPASPTWTA